MARLIFRKNHLPWFPAHDYVSPMVDVDKIQKNLATAFQTRLEPALAYDRVSTIDQERRGISLEYQESSAAAYAARAGLSVVHAFTVAESAGKAGRKTFGEMIQIALKLDIKHLIFKSTDRMSRNYKDLSLILDLIEQNGINVHLYQSNKVINKNSTHDEKFMIGIEQAVAKHQWDKASYDARQVYAYKASRGIPHFRAPIGYLYDKEKKVHYKDPDARHMLDFIFGTFDGNESMSMGALLDQLNEHGFTAGCGRQWSRGGIEKVLKNPMYAGFFMLNGTEYQAHHEPYFTREQFTARLQRLNCRYVGQKKRTFDFPLSGFLKCGETGRVLTGQIKKGRYVYYTNARIGKCFPQEKVFAMLDDFMRSISFSMEFTDELKKAFRAVFTEKLKDFDAIKRGINARITVLENKQAKLLDLYTEEGIDKDALTKKLKEIRFEINGLLSRQQGFNVDREKALLDITTCVDNLRALPHLYAEAAAEEKGAILKTAIKWINVFDDRLEIEWKRIYAELMRGGVIEVSDAPAARVPTRPFMGARRDGVRKAAERVFDMVVYKSA